MPNSSTLSAFGLGHGDAKKGGPTSFSNHRSNEAQGSRKSASAALSVAEKFATGGATVVVRTPPPVEIIDTKWRGKWGKHSKAATFFTIGCAVPWSPHCDPAFDTKFERTARVLTVLMLPTLNAVCIGKAMSHILHSVYVGPKPSDDRVRELCSKIAELDSSDEEFEPTLRELRWAIHACLSRARERLTELAFVNGLEKSKAA